MGIDRPAVLRAARARGAVHETASNLSGGLRGADLVVLALPVEGILKAIARVGRLADPEAVVTDVGGAKEAIERAARRAGLAGRFVGGHPMAGSERSGIARARASLFRGAPWILCPLRAGGRRRPGPRRGAPRSDAAGRVARFVRRLGARPEILGAREHDRAIARLSHLPQLVSVALANAADGPASRRYVRLSGPAFREMTRLASSPRSLWRGVLRANRRAAIRALDDFRRELERVRASLSDDPAACFLRAARLRARLRSPSSRAGR